MPANSWSFAADAAWLAQLPGLDEGRWVPLAVGAAVVAVAVAALALQGRSRHRRRLELRDLAADGVEALLLTALPRPSTDRPTSAEASKADELEEQARTAEESLGELDRVSRGETAAAAAALRRHTAELGQAVAARLRGEGDPNLLDVRIAELRERVRGARDRLDAAVSR